MASLRRAYGALAAGIRFLVAAVRYVRRRRMPAAKRPRLELDFIHPPSWGAETLNFAMTNSGGGGAKNCRYCRLQEFTMAGADGRPPSFSAQRWYSSDRLTIPPGVQKRGSAALTVSACPRAVLGDSVAGTQDESAYVDAIVCQDSAGTVYRFHCFLGPGAAPDMWSAGLLDRIRGVSPPAWVEWALRPEPVEPVRWSEVS
jgi:hypothetical protein